MAAIGVPAPATRASRRAEPRREPAPSSTGFRRLAAEWGASAASLAIAWLLAQGPAVVPIPGTRSVAHLKELAAGAAMRLDADDVARIEAVLPVGWAHGDRYDVTQWIGPERYC